jgi:hypothetical protein
MSLFLPESFGKSQSGVSDVTPANPETTQADIALMQRVLSAASRNPNLIPADFMAYLIDYVQTSRLTIPIGQVFGYQRIAPQVITDFGQVPDPVDGQIVLLKVGSSPFTYVQMMFDQNINQWVSEEFPAGGANASSAVNGYVNVGGSTGISWAPVHTGGLTMQLKWAGTLSNEATQADARLLLTFATPSGSSATATMLNASSAGDNVVRAVGGAWTNVSDPGAYDMVAIGMQLSRVSGGTSVLSAGAVGRFIR